MDLFMLEILWYSEWKNIVNSWGRSFYLWNSVALGIKKYFKHWRRTFLCLKFFRIRNRKIFKLSRQTFFCLKFFGIRNRKLIKGGLFLCFKFFWEWAVASLPPFPPWLHPWPNILKVIKVGLFHTIHRYVKANNQYMKDYVQSRESSYGLCWNLSNLHATKVSHEQFLMEKKLSHFILTTALLQVLDHGLILKNTHRDIKFNQQPCLKRSLDVNTKLQKKAKKDSEKNFLKLVSSSNFGRTMG